MPHLRQTNVTAAQWTANGSTIAEYDLTSPSSQIFGSNVFSVDVQRQRLPKAVFKELQAALAKGGALDRPLADSVALAMKEWALEKGASHYTHWFQPLTGSTAEKHDSFFSPTGSGGAIAEFSGKELIQAEPDASSFPNGGIRSTFEARGYTAWDPTSPAFILENPNGAYLCIPTAFVSFTGEALDAKIPLLRSMDAVSTAAVHALKLFGHDDVKRVFSSVGPEQEYFLIDEQYYFERPDLVTTGRTLFGRKPPKGQELDDHYFGSIPERVLAYMMEVEHELAKLGVPIKTRHNEVAPGQFEIAPIYENSNIGVDHQHLCMQVLKKTARNYGLVCLLHEKPFAGVNGSGKHNNWSIGTDQGDNLLSPGKVPSENLRFLFFCSAVLKGIKKHQELLRATVASAGQDHRLGANEAPPAIISIFLGADLEAAFKAVASGSKADEGENGFLGLGTPVLPPLALDGGDRNRTSPFAFTGNKFEFRAPGSGQSIGLVNTVINTIMAETIEILATELEAAINSGTPLDEAVTTIVRNVWEGDGEIVFSGDGYSEEWPIEAAKRGLANNKTTPDALPALVKDSTIELFETYNVLSKRELEARYEVFVEQYITLLNIEAEMAALMAKTAILPAALKHLALIKESGVTSLEAPILELIEQLNAAITKLDEKNAIHPAGDPIDHAVYMRDEVYAAYMEVREAADALEGVVADDLWPLPRYSEILFVK
ncbi:MAG: glutamine synthetase III [Solirubrobacteraceae bacterium]|nr:glutamine synthetase III [Solirubrobacteraceae bacterium]